MINISLSNRLTPNRSHNPNQEVSLGQVPVRSPLLRESFLLFFPLGTKMFQFPRFALSSLCIREEVLWSCLIRKPPDQSFLPAPRSVSPVIASFIASECQGIPQKPFLSWIERQKLCSQIISVEVSGLEPLTSAVQGQRSTSWAIPPAGLSWTWTRDLTLIRGVL